MGNFSQYLRGTRLDWCSSQALIVRLAGIDRAVRDGDMSALPSCAASSVTDLRSVPPSPQGKAMAPDCYNSYILQIRTTPETNENNYQQAPKQPRTKCPAEWTDSPVGCRKAPRSGRAYARRPRTNERRISEAFIKLLRSFSRKATVFPKLTTTHSQNLRSTT